MSRFSTLFPRRSPRPQRGPSSQHSCRLEPLEDRRLLAVTGFQDGVFPTPDYNGTRDAPIFASDAGVNFGEDVTLRADAEQSSTGQPAWSVIKWDLSGFPAEATINDVSLTVNVTNTTVAPGFHLFEVKTPWLESEVTWNGPDANTTWEDISSRCARSSPTSSHSSGLPRTWSSRPSRKPGASTVATRPSVIPSITGSSRGV